MNRLILTTAVGLLISAFAAGSASADKYQGTVRAGYIYTDLEGNRAVHQPTFNLYEGFSFSLERFRYQWDSGSRLSADLTNLFLNNRRMAVGFSRPGLVGISVNHTGYRRTYDFSGANFTRRRATSASAWVRPSLFLKLFGGFGITNKRGRSSDFFDPGPAGTNEIDYNLLDYHAGAEFKHRGSYGRVEYRLADFNNDTNRQNDRRSRRLRVTFYSPLPKWNKIVLSGGFQHFENEVEVRADTLNANTFWGAARYGHPLGYHIRYSFIFDRSRRTGDLTDYDNVIHTVHAGRTWAGRGGVTVGYGRRLNDDVRIKRSGDEYSLTGWARPIKPLLLRAGFDYEGDVIDSGRSLTGDRERSRHWLSAKYTHAGGYVKVMLEDRQRENADIGSRIDFLRLSLDGSASDDRLGEIFAGYAYGRGEYVNSGGAFKYGEHTVSGEARSREYWHLQLGIEGMYYRSRSDVDVESFTLELIGRYKIREDAGVELSYSVHNFDDFNDLSPFYDRYFTANVVQVVLWYEL
jgi:hypothetical protein